jgi:hypothetical protein
MANNPFGSFEDAFEQGVSQVKQTAQQQVKSTTQSVQTQFGVQPSTDQAGKTDAVAGLSDQFNETGNNQQNQQQDPQQQLATQQMEVQQQQEKQQKLAETRQQLMKLHKTTYFDPTFNTRPKEPTVQERLEKEDQERQAKKMEELHEEQKKAEPVALGRAKRTIEMNRGASG